MTSGQFRISRDQFPKESLYSVNSLISLFFDKLFEYSIFIMTSLKKVMTSTGHKTNWSGTGYHCTGYHLIIYLVFIKEQIRFLILKSRKMPNVSTRFALKQKRLTGNI